LIIRCYNEEGGAFWHLHNCVLAAHTAAVYNLQLIVLFDTGFYVEKNEKHAKRHFPNAEGGNWFDYFFHPLGESLQSVKEGIFSHNAGGGRPSFRSFGRAVGVKSIARGEILEFDRSTFESVHADQVPFATVFRTYCQPRVYVQQLVTDYMEKNMARGWTIGVHWRGTDKYGDGNDDEDGPKHFEYEWMGRTIQEAYDACNADPGKGQVNIFICTDEQPFLTYMKSAFGDAFGNVVHATKALRSDTDTGGLHLAGHLCSNEHDYSTISDCKRLKALRGTSVHRGMPDASAFQKGLDVILDVLLLSRCDQLFLSRGNVSSWASKLFTGTGPVTDMVSIYPE
jgi:hypothetical protein